MEKRCEAGKNRKSVTVRVELYIKVKGAGGNGQTGERG